MLNARYNDVGPVVLVNAPIQEPVARGIGWGRVTGRSWGIGHGRVAPTASEVPIDNVLVNENPPVNNEEI